MFAELPKLFDRDFAVGYFLPAVAFVMITLTLNTASGLVPGVVMSPTSAVQAAGLGVASLLLGILLLVWNWEIVRFLEGYGRWNPFRLKARRQAERYRTERRQMDDAYAERAAARATGDEAHIQEVIRRQDRVRRRHVSCFPNEEALLLPTAFGNTIRAFEVYPYVMYGIDAIPGWPRLLTVVPADFRALVNSAKATTDFWANLWFLGLLVLVECLAIGVHVVADVGVVQAVRHWRWLAVPALGLGVVWLASQRAAGAAAGWGELVKTAFDVFLPELRKKLELAAALAAQERAMWTQFSQAVVFREPESVAALEKWRARPAPPSDSSQAEKTSAASLISRLIETATGWLERRRH